MPRINFSTVDAVADFAPLPDGEYTCKLADIETETTRAGDPMWKLRWAVEGGEYAGRILFDNMVFSPKAMPRAKLICASCGLDVSGEVDLDPSVLMGRRARVTVYVEDFRDDAGVAKVRNRIPFGGYAAVGSTDDESCPF